MRSGVSQIPPDQGQFLALLVQLIGAKRCIEVGVFHVRDVPFLKLFTFNNSTTHAFAIFFCDTCLLSGSIYVHIFVQGYSSLAVALVLPEGGRLVACDRDERSLAIAREYYRRAGVLHKVYGVLHYG